MCGWWQVLKWLSIGLFFFSVWTAWRSQYWSQIAVLSEHPQGQTTASVGSARGEACDVFICHRGPEVKRNLVGHIKERLERANLIVFVDYEMREGVQSWQHVLATLRGSRRVLILLTPGFEESPWCLEEARAAAARPDAVLPVFIDREASWDERLLRAAHSKLSADRDFHLLRTEQSDVAADIVAHWRNALDSVAGVSFLTHASMARYTSRSLKWGCCTSSLACVHAQLKFVMFLRAVRMRSWCKGCKPIIWRSFARCRVQWLSMRWRCRA